MTTSNTTSSNKARVVVVGNGMVGHKFVESLLELDSNAFDITVFGAETRAAYDRVHLSAFFDGKTAADLALTTREWYAERGITLYLGEKVTAVDKAAKTVSSDAREIEYDQLVLATGSYPFVPPIPGHDQPHCHVYRTIDDLGQIRASGEVSKTGVVIGGGLLGLEAANAVQNLGLETHVIEFAPRLMAVQVDEGGGRMLRSKIEDLGVQVHTSMNTQSIKKNKKGQSESRFTLEFADGSEIGTDMVVFSAGIRPDDQLGRDCGVNVGERGGIEIDNFCRTTDPHIYAIGECALWGGKIFGLVAPGYQMAKVAAAHINGAKDQYFSGADMSTKLKLLGVDVASIGDAHAQTEGAQSYVFTDEANGVYKRLVVDADSSKVLGAVMIGDASDYGNLLQMTLNDMPLPEQPESLILPAVDGAASAGLGVAALPASAQLCSCNDVTKGDICDAVESGVMTMSGIKESTKAATSCGGCAALCKSVLDHELEQQGIEVNHDLCEHFPYTRQQLEHIVRIEEHKTFTGLLNAHGKGHGCEICKPTVGSILASTWNEHIMEPQHAVLQDTNDYFMANMQKDGSYSVVPRVPGGEITPDKLIVLGQVAKKYQLYTKVTGGQRIDLFGAQVQELPLIWKELIDAGFESGHAYGKSMRTVKSCVGSTWCRYGVDDSVGMAIRVEERYRGIRSPHKFKLAVSGCTRECAEAQSKDVGIIAVENGWNLYVCGNGGMKPRHADLLASEIDDETLIKYIDRFLIFYIRTADRLQRTSVWMDNLEGGLDYLKQVVCEDSLGIGDELEQQMQQLVNSYVCEWKATVEDPEKLKRFSHFVNSDRSDSNVLRVVERGQLRPALTSAEREKALPALPKTGEAA